MSYHVRQVLWMTCLCTRQVMTIDLFLWRVLIVLELGCQDSLFRLKETLSTEKNCSYRMVENFPKQRSIFMLVLLEWETDPAGLWLQTTHPRRPRGS